MAWSPDGRMLVSAGFDGSVRLWDVAAGRQARLLGSYGQAVAVVAWSPDGKTLAWGGWDGIIRFWDVATDKKRTVRLPDPGGTVESVCWSPDGAMIASAGNDKMVRLWDVAAGKLIRKLAGHNEGVRSVGWSPVPDHEDRPAPFDSQTAQEVVAGLATRQAGSNPIYRSFSRAGLHVLQHARPS